MNRYALIASVLIAACTSTPHGSERTTEDTDSGPPRCATPAELAVLSGTIVYEGDPIEGADSIRSFEIWAIGAPNWRMSFVVGGAGFDGHPNWSPDGGRIVYSSHGGGNPDLYLVDPDGSNRIRLTNDIVRDDYPIWLEQGVVYRSGEDRRIIDPARGEVEPYEKLSDAGSFAVSPDGSRMVVSKTAPTHPLTRHLYLTDADGNTIRQLTGTFPSETHPFWSPRDNRIAYSGGDGTRSGYWEVYIYDLDTDSIEQVTHNPGADWACGWSPEGQWLLITSEYNDNWDIYAIRPDGSNRLRITCHAGDARYADWTTAEFPDLGH